MIWLLGLTVAMAGLGVIITLARRLGRKGAEADAMEASLDDVHTANQARDLVRRDPAERQRVREKFTRR